MSSSTLNKLVLAVIAVFVLWGVATMVTRLQAPGHPEGAMIGVFQDLTPTSVKSIRIAHGGDTVSLVRQGVDDRWTVNGWAADSTAMAKLFAMLAKAKVGDRVASNPTNHERMGVSEGKAWTVTLDTDHGERSLLVGDVGPRYRTTYIRVPGQNDVYLAEADLRTDMADRHVSDWRNKRLASVDTSAVKEVQVSTGHGSYTLARGSGAWTLDGSGKATDQAVSGLLTQLADLRADGFLASGDSVASLPEESAVTVLGASADTLAVLRFGRGSGDHWARARGDSVTYKVPTWRVDAVAPPEASLMNGG